MYHQWKLYNTKLPTVVSDQKCAKRTTILRVSPWVHQAGVLHAISPISMKLGQFKGSTPKLKMTNWFVVWIFMVGDSPPNWFN